MCMAFCPHTSHKKNLSGYILRLVRYRRYVCGWHNLFSILVLTSVFGKALIVNYIARCWWGISPTSSVLYSWFSANYEKRSVTCLRTMARGRRSKPFGCSLRSLARAVGCRICQLRCFLKSILFSICILCVLWHIVKSKGASVRMVTLYEVLYMLSMACCDESRFWNEDSKWRF